MHSVVNSSVYSTAPQLIELRGRISFKTLVCWPRSGQL